MSCELDRFITYVEGLDDEIKTLKTELGELKDHENDKDDIVDDLSEVIRELLPTIKSIVELSPESQELRDVKYYIDKVEKLL